MERIQQLVYSCDTQNERIRKLLQQSSQLARENKLLDERLLQTLALYEITRNMNKFLEEEKIFSVFKESLQKYVKIDDCQFLKEEASASLAPDFLRVPLNLGRENIGCLAVKGLAKEDEEKFYILSAQLLPAIRRANLYRSIQELAITDSLTGAFSRRYCLQRLKEELERSLKFKLKFCILMVDIDHFKKFNDRYGHLTGDMILKEVVGAIKENLRHIDLVGRYGGEEFLILLPETSKDNGLIAAERIRRKIEANSVIAYDEKIKVTVSIGVSSFPEDAEDQRELIDKADWALYRCKNTGRNRVCGYKIYK